MLLTAFSIILINNIRNSSFPNTNEIIKYVAAACSSLEGLGYEKAYAYCSPRNLSILEQRIRFLRKLRELLDCLVLCKCSFDSARMRNRLHLGPFLPKGLKYLCEPGLHQV